MTSLSALSLIGCLIVFIICLPDTDARSCQSPCRRCITSSCRHECKPRPRWRLQGHRCMPINTCAVSRRCADKGSCPALARWRLRRHKCSPMYSCGSACRKCVIKKCRLPCTFLAKQLRSQEATCSLTCDPNCVGGCSSRGNGTCDTKCKAGYAVTPDHTCAQCDPSCTSGCAVAGPSRCDQTCISNYFLDDIQFCDECDPHCYPTIPGSCSQPGECDAVCIAGYVINTITKKCDACAEHCNSCTVAGQCDPTGCQFGYVFYGDTCPPCSPNCTTGCTQPGLCSGNCTVGYGRTDLTAESQCAPCGQNCDATSGCNARGAGYCDTKCKIGWALSSVYTCDPCQGAPCPANTDCSATGPGSCNEAACLNANKSYNSQFHTCS